MLTIIRVGAKLVGQDFSFGALSGRCNWRVQGAADAGLPIGVVTGIQGARWFAIEVTGHADHAGTTPRAQRRDALLAATLDNLANG